jgi:hypothetical protein
MCAKALTIEHGDFMQTEALPLFHREVRERLSPTALQLLLDRAETFVMGRPAARSSPAPSRSLAPAWPRRRASTPRC